MDQAKQQVIDAIKSHSNVLVTVSTNPSVDELSAALGLTIMLNNLDKRSTSVFSGSIPPAINFLEPGKTFVNSADSLRDFIIALDKEKADHLRYKVEGDSVKIFITPYKTQLGQSDLVFSQGEYNVELIIALGVTDQGHLDKALEAHGQILHNATVLTVTTGQNKSNLGSIDWHDEKSSSLSEMVASLADVLKGEKPLLDQQISTALLTGIVSATNRFSNEHTTTSVMTVAAQLMAAGANQQLVAAKLEETHDIAPNGQSNNAETQPSKSDQELTIERTDNQQPANTEPVETQNVVQDDPQSELEKHIAKVTASPNGSMADIENQLKQAAQQPVDQQPQTPPPSPVDTSDLPPPEQPAPVEVELPTTPQDATMPGFEPTGNETPPPQQPLPPPEATPSQEPPPAIFTPPPPELPPEQPQTPPPVQPVEHPRIIQRNDVLSTPPGGAPPINSVTSGSEEDQPYVNPFDTPVSNVDHQENATYVATINPLIESPSPQPAHVGVPELPPLPSMPVDSSNMPLPPPPPSPVNMAGGSMSPMSAGPVSGDIFGDNTAIETPAPVVAEPGQFKIPGQA